MVTPALASVITEHFLFMFGSNQILIKLRTAHSQIESSDKERKNTTLQKIHFRFELF